MKLKLNNGKTIEINSNVYQKHKKLDIGRGIKLKPVGFIPAQYKDIELTDAIDPELKFDSDTNWELLGTKYWIFDTEKTRNGCSKSEFFEILDGPINMLGKVVTVFCGKAGLVFYIVNILK